MENFYVILSLPRDASDEEIRRAYRLKCRECHPDLSGEECAEDFHAVSRAYETLSDPARRAAYDRDLQRSESRPRTVLSDRVRVLDDFEHYRPSVERILDHFMGAPTRRPMKSGQVRRLTIEVVLDPEESLYGGVLPLEVPVYAACPICDGSGRMFGFFCTRCDGEGVLADQCVVAVPIPPGMADRSVLEYPLDDVGVPDTMLSVLIRSAI